MKEAIIAGKFFTNRRLSKGMEKDLYTSAHNKGFTDLEIWEDFVEFGIYDNLIGYVYSFDCFCDSHYKNMSKAMKDVHEELINILKDTSKKEITYVEIDQITEGL